MSKCQYKVLNDPLTPALLEPTSNQSKAQNEFQDKKENVFQSFKEEVSQTVSFSKNKKTNHRTKELKQPSAKLHDQNNCMSRSSSSLNSVEIGCMSKVTNKVPSAKILDKNPNHKTTMPLATSLKPW